MGKYTDQAKLAAVVDYCSGESGLKSVASRHDVDVSMLRQWVAAYRALGEAGVQTKKRTFYSYTPEFKLSVLRRMWKDGLSRRQAAALFDIRCFNVIGAWEIKYNRGGLDALKAAPTGPRKKMPDTSPVTDQGKRRDPEPDRHATLDELGRLRAENAYLKKLSALVRENDR